MVIPSPPRILATLDQLKRHVGVEVNDDDALLEEQLDAATAIVLEYIERPTDAAWTATLDAWDVDTVPSTVRAAILRQAAHLYRFRGDDTDLPVAVHGFLSPLVVQLLHRYRDPALA